MPKYSAPDAFQPAFARTKALLLHPFRFGFWCRVMLLGILTGELSANGCSFNFDLPSDLMRDRGRQQFISSDIWQRLAPYFWLIFIGALVLFVLILLFMYIGSRCRFILFEAVVDGHVRLRQSWRKWKDQGTEFFLFLLAYTFAIWAALAVFVGLPILFAYLSGFSPRQHIAAAALGIAFMVCIGLLIVVCGTVFYVLTKDFAVPIMALENLSISAALRRLLGIIREQKGSFAGYIGMKIVITIGASIVVGLATVIVLLPIIFVIVIFAIITVLIGVSAGLTWTPFTIALAVALAANAILGMSILICFAQTPIAVFFPSYALLYFAGRYAPLHDRLFPPPAPPAPIMPPDLPPEPALG